MLVFSKIEFATPEYDEAVALRYLVLRKPLGLQYSPEQLAAEWADSHLAAFNGQGNIVGCLILTDAGGQAVKMRQVAVLPELQGKGVGTALVAYSEDVARAKQFEKMVLHARETAVPFYLKLGYKTVGTPFEEVGLPHFKMEKAL